MEGVSRSVLVNDRFDRRSSRVARAIPPLAGHYLFDRGRCRIALCHVADCKVWYRPRGDGTFDRSRRIRRLDAHHCLD